jgi:2'-5' RNA ligase
MRCFIACELPESVRSDLSNALTRMRDRAPFLKWVKAENLHFTVKFLGEVKDHRLDEIKNLLKDVAETVPPFSLKLGSLGTFGSRADLRVLWLGLDEGAETLAEVAAKVERAMDSVGFPPEDRPFRSHLTLARSRRHSSDKAGIGDFEDIDVGSPYFSVDALVLFQSRLTPEGPIYTKLETFPFHG